MFWSKMVWSVLTFSLLDPRMTPYMFDVVYNLRNIKHQCTYDTTQATKAVCQKYVHVYKNELLWSVVAYEVLKYIIPISSYTLNLDVLK